VGTDRGFSLPLDVVEVLPDPPSQWSGSLTHVPLIARGARYAVNGVVITACKTMVNGVNVARPGVGNRSRRAGVLASLAPGLTGEEASFPLDWCLSSPSESVLDSRTDGSSGVALSPPYWGHSRGGGPEVLVG